MDLIYKSTRNDNETVTASQAILYGLAKESGLYVPSFIPKMDVSLEDLSKMSYQETAYEVLKLFLTDFTEEELKYCINSAYDSKFDCAEIAPIVQKDGANYLELFHCILNQLDHKYYLRQNLPLQNQYILQLLLYH